MKNVPRARIVQNRAVFGWLITGVEAVVFTGGTANEVFAVSLKETLH